MVDRLPEFQGPKYAGSFRRGDFADFHQRFSLVGNAYPGHPPQRDRSSMRRSAYPPGGDLIPPRARLRHHRSAGTGADLRFMRLRSQRSQGMP